MSREEWDAAAEDAGEAFASLDVDAFEEALDRMFKAAPPRMKRPGWTREEPRRPGPCGCECCRGEFCGGCGHAGCGRR